MRIGPHSLLAWSPRRLDVTLVSASAVRVPVCAFSYPNELLLDLLRMYTVCVMQVCAGSDHSDGLPHLNECVRRLRFEIKELTLQ